MPVLNDHLIEEIREKIATIGTFPALEELKATYLGPHGILRDMMKQMKDLVPEERAELGKKVNYLKNEIETLLVEKLEELEAQALRQKMGDPIDISLDTRKYFSGNLHPLTKTRQRVEEIFNGLGFCTVDGPEIETEWYCFDALNTPLSHPARDVMDTFFMPQDIRVATTSKYGTERYLLRSHTSTVQIRTMLKERPPIRIISPGRTFRRDTTDATHSANFHQFEALYVDENVTVSDLKATLDYFLKALFGPKTETRLRPSFFPFTEPSFEVDFRSTGLGKLSSQWIEILGCGMVDPNVLEAVEIDPNRHSGFAAGLGLERLTMLLYGIDDVRLFYQNDLRFLEQFA
ncbi:MAG: phenylalanine--tRNA ligase subunit alpha [Puniceicoccales bacterium]|jgi:phenylalanyl-tRNA synthetase alpha chain|nr:phenylalanine--tRNA ligase subunit alpha [Puniceicoccales bacterium]